MYVAELAEFITTMSAGLAVAFNFARDYPSLAKTLTQADPAGSLQAEGEPPATLPPALEALGTPVADLIVQGEFDAGLEMFVRP